MADFLPFSRPALGEEELAAVEQVLRSGWITTGPKNQELEQQFAALTGAKHAISVSSATGGMHVTLMALGIGAGDEVITPSLTWVSTLNMIVLLGAHAWHLFIIRVDEARCGIDRDGLMQALKERNIGTGLHFRAAHTQKYYRERFTNLHLPNTDWNSARICSLPLFPDMHDEDVDRVVEALAELAGKH